MVANNLIIYYSLVRSVFMSKGIKGKDIYKIKRLDEKRIVVIFNNGRELIFEATMIDYYDCALLAYRNK